MAKRSEPSRVYEWFSRWRSPLRRFLASRARGRVADLDDMAQEVFLRLLRYGDAEVIEFPQAYLFKVASNVAAEWAIRPGQRFAHDSRWLEELVVEDGIDESLDDGAFQLRMKQALMRLSSRERAIIKLHFDEGLSRPHIAVRLGLTERVVRRELEKAYSKLRRDFGAGRDGEQDYG